MKQHELSRQAFVKMVLLAGATYVSACGRSASYLTPAANSGGETPIYAITPTPAKSPMPKTGLLPSPTKMAGPTFTPAPTTVSEMNIKNIIILVQENHSFDSLFADFPGANGKRATKRCPETTINTILDKTKPYIAYDCSYEENEIPIYWKLAQSFVLCDNYFTEVRGPSYPNWLMLGAAQTDRTNDPPAPWQCPHICVDIPAMPNLLDENGLTWHDYGGLLADIKSLSGREEISYGTLDGFFQSAADGKLPNVTWIGAYLVGKRQASGHPPSDICFAENFAVSIIDAVMQSPQWESSLLFLTWDEWGGFFDHITPPVVEHLSNGAPLRYGFRVPCIVISPYARQGMVCHTQLSHVSLLKTIETIFGLKPLNERDSAASSMLECLNLDQQPLAPISITTRACGL